MSAIIIRPLGIQENLGKFTVLMPMIGTQMIIGISWLGVQVLGHHLGSRKHSVLAKAGTVRKLTCQRESARSECSFTVIYMADQYRCPRAPAILLPGNVTWLGKEQRYMNGKHYISYLWGQDTIIIAPSYICKNIYKVALQMLPHLILSSVKWGQECLSYYPIDRGGYGDSEMLGDLPKGRQNVKTSQRCWCDGIC